MEHTLTFALGKFLGKVYLPAVAAQVVASSPTRKAAEPFKTKSAKYCKSNEGFRNVDYVTNLKPKYHKIERSKWMHTSTMEPKQIAQRTEYSDELKHTFNNLSGSVNSVAVYPDNKKLYDRLVKGESCPTQWGATGDMGSIDGMSKHNGKRQMTAGRVLAGMRAGSLCVPFLQNVYNIPDDKVAMLGSQKFLGYLEEQFPGGRGEAVIGMMASGANQTAANTTVVIRPTSQKTKDNGEEHAAIDDGWTLSYEDTARSRYKISNPVRGINTPEDTLTEHSHITVNNKVTAQSASVNNTAFRAIRGQYTSLQEAIFEADSMGYNWYVESDKGNSYPVSRHPLYVNNFLYRGCTKKRLGEKGAKRQKGGDAPRVVEWDPSIENHFEGKSKEDVFYA